MRVNFWVTLAQFWGASNRGGRLIDGTRGAAARAHDTLQFPPRYMNHCMYTDRSSAYRAPREVVTSHPTSRNQASLGTRQG